MCFVFRYPKDSFISSDAMSKLRQKNPGTVRTPEEDRGRANYTMDYTVDLSRAAIISPHIPDVCSEAGDATFVRHEDIVVWALAQGKAVLTGASAKKERTAVVGMCVVDWV